MLKIKMIFYEIIFAFKFLFISFLNMTLTQQLNGKRLYGIFHCWFFLFPYTWFHFVVYCFFFLSFCILFIEYSPYCIKFLQRTSEIFFRNLRKMIKFEKQVKDKRNFFTSMFFTVENNFHFKYRKMHMFPCRNKVRAISY